MKTSQNLIEILKQNQQKIKDILMEYQPIQVTAYEIERCIYTLEHIEEIKEYFVQCTNIKIIVFLPSNLPLYSLLLFAIIPSYIVQKVILRPNSALIEKSSLEELFRTLNMDLNQDSTIELFSGDKEKFLRDYVAIADLIIFTGKNTTQKLIKKWMKSHAFMINNGSGHNPIVVTENADIDKAVECVIYTKFFNSGQDCAGPDAVFIHKKIESKFIQKLEEGVRALKVGVHSDPTTFVGAIHREQEIYRLKKIIDNNKGNLILGGKIEGNVIHPTIILSNIISQNLNYNEIFGPILFLYTYADDSQLKLYFNSSRYRGNKMYVSIFGNSEYIESRNDDILIQDKSTAKTGIGRVLYKKNIHDIEVDNGTVAYGGYSRGASSVVYKDKDGTLHTNARPILIPKEIDGMFNEHLEEKKNGNTKIRKKIVRKFIRKTHEIFSDNLEFAFVFGSVNKGNYLLSESDIDTFVCIKNYDYNAKQKFIEWVIKLQDKIGLKYDKVYPSEIFTSDEILSFIYQLHYRLSEYEEHNWINSHYWIDNGKIDCSFVATFEYHDNYTFDAIFVLAIMSEYSSLEFASLEKNKKLLGEIVKESQKIIKTVIGRIFQNLENFKEAYELPKYIKEKHSKEKNIEEIINKLRILENNSRILENTIDTSLTSLKPVQDQQQNYLM